MRRRLLVLLALLVVGVLVFFAVGPGVVERSLNKVTDEDLLTVPSAAAELHQELTVVDMHSDTLLWDRDLLDRSSRGHMDLPRLVEGNVALQVFSSVSKTPRGQNLEANSDETDNITLLAVTQLQPLRTWRSLLERSLFHADKLDRAARESGDGPEGELRLVRTVGDLETLLADRAAGQRVTGAMFSVEGLHNLEGDAGNLEHLFDAGTRMAGFTHFFDNEVAGSMHGEEKGGLTALGREVLARMQERGMVVDIAHASPAAVDEILAAASAPVVSSHGGVRGTCEANRNLSDDQVRAVAATGGVVGIGYWSSAVCARTPEAVVDALEHVMEVGGVETAALGSDYDGSVAVGWDTSQLSVITAELLARGHDESTIAAVMGGNTLRVLREVLPR